MTPSVVRTSLPFRATNHHHQRTCNLWELVGRESQGGERGPARGKKVGYGGEEEEEEGGGGGGGGNFVERTMVAQVQVHDLMGKENPDLVTIGHRFYLSDKTHAGQSLCTYSRFALLVLLSWV